MSDVANPHVVQEGDEQPERAFYIARIQAEQPWYWLAAGTRDLLRAPWPSLLYGVGITALSFLITAGVVLLGQLHWLLPLLGGFMFIGPLLAVGFYAVSQKLEAGERPTVGAMVAAARSNPMQLALMGVIQGLILLFWFRLATLLFALFFGGTSLNVETLVAHLTSFQGVGMLLVGSGVGAVFALVLFAVTVVSIPFILDTRSTCIEGVLASLRAFARNPGALLLWGIIITALAIAGLATFYVGLMVIMPLLGHATWHAYRDLVRWQPA